MSEGVKLDTGKIRTDLLPFDALESVSAVLAHGATKYEARNWEKGFAWGRLLGAAMRHLFSWAGGQDIDSESGLPHLSHAACCVLMLLALTIRGIGSDDRTAKVDRQIPAKTMPSAAPAEHLCGDQCSIPHSKTDSSPTIQEAKDIIGKLHHDKPTCVNCGHPRGTMNCWCDK